MLLALHLGADAVWILNNDTVVAPETLTHMRERLFSSPRPGLCGSLIRYMAEPDFVQCLGGGHTNRWTGLSYLIGHKQSVSTMQMLPNEAVEKQLNFIYGASVMVSKNFLTTVGVLDERYFMYCEEQDWAFRAAGRFDLVYSRQAHVWHKEGASTGWPKKANNFFAMRHLFRSRLLLAAKHTPVALPLVLTSVGYALLRMINYFGIRKDLLPNVVDASPTKQGKFLPGSRIPVYAPSLIKKIKPDYLLILPWNLKNEIMEQHKYIREWGGRFVTIIPHFEIL